MNQNLINVIAISHSKIIIGRMHRVPVAVIEFQTILRINLISSNGLQLDDKQGVYIVEHCEAWRTLKRKKT